jgi:hypothetical protein
MSAFAVETAPSLIWSDRYVVEMKSDFESESHLESQIVLTMLTPRECFVPIGGRSGAERREACERGEVCITEQEARYIGLEPDRTGGWGTYCDPL